MVSVLELERYRIGEGEAPTEKLLIATVNLLTLSLIGLVDVVVVKDLGPPVQHIVSILGAHKQILRLSCAYIINFHIMTGP